MLPECPAAGCGCSRCNPGCVAVESRPSLLPAAAAGRRPGTWREEGPVRQEVGGAMMPLTVCFPLPHLCCPGVSPVALQPGPSPSWLAPPTGSAPSQRSRTSCTVWTNQRTVRQPGRVSQPLDRGTLMHSTGQVMCASGRGLFSSPPRLRPLLPSRRW